MPRVGEVYETSLEATVLYCIDVHHTDFGVHYKFLVLENKGSSGSLFRVWMDSDYDFGLGTFGMRKAFESFKFRKIA
jgi:hypothetical protein